MSHATSIQAKAPVEAIDVADVPVAFRQIALLWRRLHMRALDKYRPERHYMRGPGPKIDLALDVRKMGVEAIQTDARDLKLTIDALGQQIREARENLIASRTIRWMSRRRNCLFRLLCRLSEEYARRERSPE